MAVADAVAREVADALCDAVRVGAPAVNVPLRVAPEVVEALCGRPRAEPDAVEDALAAEKTPPVEVAVADVVTEAAAHTASDDAVQAAA